MNAINYRVSLDMFDVSSQITIKAKKGDSACKIYITLTKSGKIYNITEGCYATFSAKKADGNFVYNDCTIEGNTIVYDFTSSIIEDGSCQITACVGAVSCEVALFNDKGEQLTSPRFVLVVDETVYSGEDINSSESIKGVKEVIDRANKLVDEIETKLENGEFNGKDGEITNLDQTYNPESENAQSGKAVAQAIANAGGGGGSITVDQTYSPTSKNAQSGVAMAGALQGYVPKVKGNAATDQVYAVDMFGEQKTVEIEDTMIFKSGAFNFAGNLPRRNERGNLMTLAPTTDLECANKKYVDDLTGDIGSALDELHNYAQAIIGGAE